MRSQARIALVGGLAVAAWAAAELAGPIHDRAPAVAAAATLLIEHGVTVGGLQSDRVTWTDAAGQARVAALSHNRGGALVQFRYQTPGGTRVAGVTTTGEAAGGGFGYVVSHPSSEGNCTGTGDPSTLGFTIPGTFQRVFEGRHHAIFRFTQSYPRFCAKTGPALVRTLPVTIEWVIATGRDHPLWAVTWDLSGVPAGVLEDDSRAPHGELLFDGSATSPSHATIAGVAWGERYRFTSTPDAGPVTYNSSWTWNVENSVPYVKLWTVTPDATMGTVQTQTMSQQDAGGHLGFPAWQSTSTIFGPACPANGEFPGATAHVMPCSVNWPYESINLRFGPPTGGDDDDTTNSTRLGWGTNFGFLGQTEYPVMGSVDLGGPVGNGIPLSNPYALEDATAPGRPKKSYSTMVVLGRHTVGPVEAQVEQIETVQATALTATEGSIRTSGPAGVNRTDTVTYAPAGWNHVYAGWAVQAAVGNQVDVNVNVGGGGTLTNPLIIVSGWTTGDLPDAVRLNGVALVQDVDYFPSVRAGAQELWITLDRDLTGPTNRLEVSGPTFADVPASHFARAYIEALFRAGVTGGCSTSPLSYCPEDPVTREQMAVFLLKGHDGAGFTPPACTTPPFADVPCSSVFADWIQELATRGITVGCGGGAYCPTSAVTREQMAVFLLRTLGVIPGPCTAPGPFADVPCQSPFAVWIQELVTRGITAGCTATTYCPTDPVTRAQMAVFLVKAFSLPFPAPALP